MKIYPPQDCNAYIMGTMLLLQTTGHFSSHIFTCRKASSYLYLYHHCLSQCTLYDSDNSSFCRIFPTFWYVTARWLSDSTSVQWSWWTPALICPTSTSTRCDSVCSHSLLYCYVVWLKTNGHFFWLTFTTRSIHEDPFYFLFISDHLSMHVP